MHLITSVNLCNYRPLHNRERRDLWAQRSPPRHPSSHPPSFLPSLTPGSRNTATLQLESPIRFPSVELHSKWPFESGFFSHQKHPETWPAVRISGLFLPTAECPMTGTHRAFLPSRPPGDAAAAVVFWLSQIKPPLTFTCPCCVDTVSTSLGEVLTTRLGHMVKYIAWV